MFARILFILILTWQSASVTALADSNAEIEAKINKLLGQMTLEEKIGQMTQSYWISNSPEKIEDYKRQVLQGKTGSFLGSSVSRVSTSQRNSLQKIAVEQSRLGIPLIFGYDVIHGYRTIFPIPLAQSCSWNPALLAKAAAVAAREAASDGVDWTFAPMIDISRDPRWGRIAESFGEDPYLTSVLAEAAVSGFQGSDLSSRSSLAACLKHFVAYGAAEGGRDYNTGEVSERTLREIYLPPFKAGVDAGAATVMSAFNEVSGIPATANYHTLTEILKQQWKFDGFVISDWASVKELIVHGFAANPAEAAKKAVTAGIDMDMQSGTYSDNLAELVKRGIVPETVINEAVRRILRVKFRKGLFDNPYTDLNLTEDVMLCEDHLKAARELARESIVLLKNDANLLPLSKDVNSIALIGPFANNQADLLGTWSALGQSGDVVSVLQGIREKLPGESKVVYAKGCDVDNYSLKQIAAAVKVARQADVVILALGESQNMTGEAHSRTNIDLPEAQQKLATAVCATGKPVAVVLFNGRPLSISSLAEEVGAIMVAWHGGVQAGHAVADCLFADYNPSGKLTASWPRTAGQIPIYYNHKNTGRPPQPGIRYASNYIDCPHTPLFAFGYGLSYTTFDYNNITLSDPNLAMDKTLTVTAEVTNTGSRAGQEVVQLYIRDLSACVTRPVKELKGFAKIYLEPGATRQVLFEIKPETLAFYNDKMIFAPEPGRFKLQVGPNSTQGLETEFDLVEPKAKPLIKFWPPPTPK